MPETRAEHRAWVAERTEEFRNLAGRVVIGWDAVEMAIRENGPDGSPVFEHPDVECFQLLALDLHFDGHSALAVHTYQDDVEWGLQLDQATASEPGALSGIFRRRRLPDLPRGRVDGVRVNVSEDDNIAEVWLTITDRTVIFVAGEVHEQNDGSVRLVRNDESVLLFRSEEDLASTLWS
jgi:hypothetical protein